MKIVSAAYAKTRDNVSHLFSAGAAMGARSSKILLKASTNNAYAAEIVKSFVKIYPLEKPREGQMMIQ